MGHIYHRSMSNIKLQHHNYEQICILIKKNYFFPTKMSIRSEIHLMVRVTFNKHIFFFLKLHLLCLSYYHNRVTIVRNISLSIATFCTGIFVSFWRGILSYRYNFNCKFPLFDQISTRKSISIFFNCDKGEKYSLS